MSDIFKNMLENYDESHTSSGASAKKYDPKNYFGTFLEKKENSATKRVRLLPPQNGAKVPWVIKWGHKIQVDGAWRTFACLKHEQNEACPFCEAREELLSTGIESDKKLAKKYSAKKMYILKVIDRANEEDGVKFWRFNHDYRKTGILDKIVAAIVAVDHDISHEITGRDLNITIARDQNGNAVVQSISYPLQSTPLSSDPNLAAEWLSDDRTWHDVYSVKDYDYLAIIVGGGIPVFDKAKNKFVSKASLEENKGESEEFDSELTMGNSPSPTTQSSSVNNEVDEDEDDDLPF